ncbi:hypothetical protein LZ32DRAFT_345569 [Colletotrichum eremochloae]|nr:hypothetical protein LZ32DRAFT_345569 [Colletotrichum eremochloae]
MCCMNREAGSCVGSSSHLIYAGMVGSLRARTNKASWRRCWWRFPSFEMTYPITSSLAWLYEKREKERGFGVRQRRRESEEETGHDTYARDMTSKTQKGRARETQRIREAQIRARTRLRVDGEGEGRGRRRPMTREEKKQRIGEGRGLFLGTLAEAEGRGKARAYRSHLVFHSYLLLPFRFLSGEVGGNACRGPFSADLKNRIPSLILFSFFFFFVRTRE